MDAADEGKAPGLVMAQEERRVQGLELGRVENVLRGMEGLRVGGSETRAEGAA
jgi:hypothetical protein